MPQEIGFGTTAGVQAPPRGAFRRFLDGDIFYSFKRSPLVITAAVIFLVIVLAALLAPWVAPHNPFDLRTLNLLDAFTPPSWKLRDVTAAYVSPRFGSVARTTSTSWSTPPVE